MPSVIILIFMVFCCLCSHNIDLFFILNRSRLTQANRETLPTAMPQGAMPPGAMPPGAIHMPHGAMLQPRTLARIRATAAPAQYRAVPAPLNEDYLQPTILKAQKPQVPNQRPQIPTQRPQIMEQRPQIPQEQVDLIPEEPPITRQYNGPLIPIWEQPLPDPHAS